MKSKVFLKRGKMETNTLQKQCKKCILSSAITVIEFY